MKLSTGSVPDKRRTVVLEALRVSNGRERHQ